MTMVRWVAAAVVMVASAAVSAEMPAMFSAMKFVEAKTKARDTGKLFVVDATAEWCGPCKKMDRTTWVDEKVVAWVKENAIAIQVDVDKEPELAEHLKIKAMPTIIVMRNEETLDRAVGYKSAEQFLAWMGELKNGRVELKPPEDVAAGGKANIQEHLQYAQRLVERGELDKATAEYAWLWENMLKHDRNYAGVRVSFMAGDMESLAADHEAAKKRFTELRDATEERLKEFPAGSKSPTGARLRTDWVVLNRIIGDAARTLVWYDEQRAAGIAVKDIPGIEMMKQTIQQRGKPADIGALLGDPLTEVNQTIEMPRVVMPDPNGGGDAGGPSADDLRRADLGVLYGSYLAADRGSDATIVAGRCFKVDDTPQMRMTLVKYAILVGRPLEKHREWLEQAAAAGGDVASLRTDLEKALQRAAAKEPAGVP